MKQINYWVHFIFLSFPRIAAARGVLFVNPIFSNASLFPKKIVSFWRSKWEKYWNHWSITKHACQNGDIWITSRHLILAFVQNRQYCLWKLDGGGKMLRGYFHTSYKRRNAAHRAANNVSAGQAQISEQQATHKVSQVENTSDMIWQMDSFKTKSPETSLLTSCLRKCRWNTSNANDALFLRQKINSKICRQRLFDAARQSFALRSSHRSTH